MEWSPQQSKGLQAIAQWLTNPRQQVFRLFGYAGTGKTTLAREVENLGCDGYVQYAAFTGKAASVLREKGCYNATTIHSLIYRVLDGPGGTVIFELWPDAPQMQGLGLLIIDEVSMVDQQLGRDLESFGIKILVLGDPAQLPPVRTNSKSTEGYFTTGRPDFMLTEVHRQALDSPIIRLATQARNKERITYGDYGLARVIEWSEVSKTDILTAGQVICGKNTTRHTLNRQIRAARGHTTPVPQAGEKLICLRNDKEKGLLNGTIWYLHSGQLTNAEHSYRKGQSALDEFSDLDVSEDFDINRETIDPRALTSWFRGVVRTEEFPEIDEETGLPILTCRNVLIPMPYFFGTESKLEWQDIRGKEQFTYGYAITAHKAQGSQWDKVVVYDESNVFREHPERWLYTAITRAAKELVLVR